MSRTSLVLHSAALILVYSLYSVLQEKIMKSTYGVSGHERFTSSALLVLSNRLFSLVAGVCFALLMPEAKSSQNHDGTQSSEHFESSSGTFLSVRDRLRPHWPLKFYAMVAGANFLSTFCQYEALRWVGFTTQALAKCAKMVPVIVIGRIIYKKSYKGKEYVAGGVVILGCGFYLLSRTPTTHPEAEFDGDVIPSLESLIGALLLALYLFFDGLTSTTQEYYFGKKTKTESEESATRRHPLAPGEPVLDQMVFVNLSACFISLACCLIDREKGSNSLLLMLQDTCLWMDVTMLSATATFGLVILYDTIFKHGALTVATVMTLRQFFSILLNGGVFGNFASMGFEGCVGVGLVAAGVFIKTDARFDKPRPLDTSSLPQSDEANFIGSKGPLKELPSYSVGIEVESHHINIRLLAIQYATPVVTAVLASSLVWTLMGTPMLA